MTRQETSTAVFYNGKIITLDKENALASALSIEDGRIVSVGSDTEVRRTVPRASQIFNLKGRVVVPGLIDCHTHFIQMGLDTLSIELSQTKTIDEALSLIESGAKRVPEGEWVIATGWRESGWTHGRFITRRDLDSVCPKHPVVAHRVCGHLSSVNSLALLRLGIDRKTKDAEVDASGKMTGVLTESAVTIVREATRPSSALRSKGLELAVRKAHSLGVTSVHDNGESSDFSTYCDAEKVGQLRVRVWFNSPADSLDSRVKSHISTGMGSHWLKTGGLKVFCDGALGARTAALSKPYSDDPHNKGSFVYRRREFDELIEEANDASIQIAIHAIGDVGIAVAVTSLKTALRKKPQTNHRHRIEHLELPSKSHLLLMNKLGLMASMQPNFVGEWGGTSGMYLSRLGKARTSRNNPFNEVLRSGVKLLFGSDCMPMSPLYGIHSAVNAPFHSQRISAFDAISAYTREAAFGSFEENLKGSISKGKFGDFVVLSGDPLEHPKEIGSMTVLRTVVGGEVVYERIPREVSR